MRLERNNAPSGKLKSPPRNKMVETSWGLVDRAIVEDFAVYSISMTLQWLKQAPGIKCRGM